MSTEKSNRLQSLYKHTTEKRGRQIWRKSGWNYRGMNSGTNDVFFINHLVFEFNDGALDRSRDVCILTLECTRNIL